MKNSVFIWFLLFILSCQNEEKNDSLISNTHKYNVESGIIKYNISIIGYILDTTITGVGSEEIHFENWGNKEIKETFLTKKREIIFANSKRQETIRTHNIQKINDDFIFYVDFNKRVIKKNKCNSDIINNKSSSLIKDFDLKKTGNEVLHGYYCEIWESNGIKQWLYKGIPLKTEIIVMGIKTIKEIDTADFNVLIADSKFNIPNFPIHKE